MTEETDDLKMPLQGHLQELRKRLLYSVGGIFVVFLVAWNFSHIIIAVVQAPVLPMVKSLQFDTLTDPFFSHLKAAFFTALFLTFPLTLSQIWLFIGPALYKKEKQVVWPFLLISYPLFVGGAMFFYFLVFPFAVEFLVNFDPRLEASLRIGDYLSFTVRLIFVFGFVFELPLVSLLLTRMGMITHTTLKKSRRYAIIGIFVTAAILTPPDILTQVLLAGPLIILYEISIIVSWLVAPKKDPTEEDDEGDEDEDEDKDDEEN